MSQGSMNDGANATWLPNLVGGVSMWKLAVDLNEPQFFDGRLLVPETEGSESLPVTVRWDLTGLVPLAQARATDPAGVAAATQDFQAALGRVAKVFATPNSGYDRYKGAFTVPSLEADNGASYFYSPSQKKLFVINWGASPRSMGGRAEYVFGYEDWGKAFDVKPPAAPSGAASTSVLPGAMAVAAAAVAEPTKEEKKDEPKKDDGKKRPWWMWPLFALAAIVIVLLALFLLKACNDEAKLGADAGVEAGADGAVDGAVATEAGADADADADGSADGGAEASADAGAEAGSADGGGPDGGKDGGAASNDEDDDDDESGGSGSGGGSGGGSGSSGGGAPVKVTMGGAPGGGAPAAKQGPHRRHFQAEAQKWRIASGNDRVTRTEARGGRFDVWLAPNKTFQGVAVEWQDKGGKWHAH